MHLLPERLEAVVAQHERVQARGGPVLLIVFLVFAALFAAPFIARGFNDVSSSQCPPGERFRECVASVKAENRNVALLGVLFPSAIAVFAAVATIRMKRSAGAVRSALKSPADVLWIYPVQVDVQGLSVARPIALSLRNGKTVRLSTTSTTQEAALAALRAYLPHAMVGYGDEQQAQYESLRD
ncbi:MAG: hypothetical protein ACYC8T_36410 [Myxococcaceae bacterium]